LEVLNPVQTSQAGEEASEDEKMGDSQSTDKKILSGQNSAKK